MVSPSATLVTSRVQLTRLWLEAQAQWHVPMVSCRATAVGSRKVVLVIVDSSSLHGAARRVIMPDVHGMAVGQSFLDSDSREAAVALANKWALALVPSEE